MAGNLSNNTDPGKPLIDLDGIRAAYDEKGYVQISSIYSATEIQEWKDESKRLWSLPEVKQPDSFRVDHRATIEGNLVPERLDPVTDVSPLFAALALDERILSIIGSILGDFPVLFKDKLIVKPPGVMGYPLHQDFAYIDFLGFEGSMQLAACIAIDKTDSASGPIEFFPGLHHTRLPSPKGRVGEADECAIDISAGCVVEMNPGDMVLFSSLCPHRSAPNRSTMCRRLLFFTYNAQSSGDFYAEYYRMGKP
ncbi:MAG: hypothetical protein DRR06_12170 [Gammaproteobacteria bacterium]|nr:MAG: hypothetical protein DRR06_12170 [Gammaproteobacteria bacterium]